MAKNKGDKKSSKGKKQKDSKEFRKEGPGPKPKKKSE